MAALIASAALLLAACDRAPAGKNPAVAVIEVGSRVITLDEYTSAFDHLTGGGGGGVDGGVAPGGGGEPAPGEAELRALKQDLVNRFVEQALIETEAATRGISVAPDELARVLAELEAGYEDVDFTEQVMMRYGSLAAWKAEVRRSLLIKKVFDAVTGPGRDVTDDEARAYYDDNIEEFDTPEMVRARMIVVGSREDADRVRLGLTAGNFAEVAREVSISPEGREGGDLGYFARGEMPEEFERTVFPLKPGQVSAVVRTGYGYHIFLALDRNRARRVGFNEAREGIMKRIRVERAEGEFADWVATLKINARIVIKEELL
jgi:peptidyl-prolyl cis-trans isomerase C